MNLNLNGKTRLLPIFALLLFGCATNPAKSTKSPDAAGEDGNTLSFDVANENRGALLLYKELTRNKIPARFIHYYNTVYKLPHGHAFVFYVSDGKYWERDDASSEPREVLPRVNQAIAINSGDTSPYYVVLEMVSNEYWR